MTSGNPVGVALNHERCENKRKTKRSGVRSPFDAATKDVVKTVIIANVEEP
jgi:hypothetical protein